MGKKSGEKMKSGEICNWLDQGPAVLLEEKEILDPILNTEIDDYLSSPDDWPKEMGWTVRLLLTDEILHVHEETLLPMKIQSR